MKTEKEKKLTRQARNRRYYEKHKTEILEKQRKYMNEHKEEVQEYNKKYNATRKNANVENASNSYKRWTERDRVELVKMKILEEKPVEEIAEELNRSEKSIRNELINDRNDEIIKICNERKEYYDSFFLIKKIIFL